MHYHDPDEVHENYFIGKNGSEVKEDYEVKTYILVEFSANQNNATVGEKNDEDHVVPSVMKLTEELTDEKVDEETLETDVDEKHCLQQLTDVSVLQIAENRGSCHSIPRERIPEQLIAQIVNMSGRTQSGREDHQRFSTSLSKMRTHRMLRLSQDTIQQ